jgi:hypothetical protein
MLKEIIMPARLTQETAIKRLKAKHGNRYDYSQTVYKGTQSKLNITCKKHGVFYQTFDNHASGQHCPKCSGVKSKSTETFIRAAKKLHGNTYAYSKVEYSTNNSK